MSKHQTPDEPTSTPIWISFEQAAQWYAQECGGKPPWPTKTVMVQSVISKLTGAPPPKSKGILSDEQRRQLTAHFAGQVPTWRAIQAYISDNFGVFISDSNCSYWASQIKQATLKGQENGR